MHLVDENILELTLKLPLEQFWPLLISLLQKMRDCKSQFLSQKMKSRKKENYFEERKKLAEPDLQVRSMVMITYIITFCENFPFHVKPLAIFFV
jgi:hypothetical protein